MAEAQHFNVAAKNYTKYDFLVGSEQMDHGAVYDKANIKASTATLNAFYTRGDRDAAAGTTGQLTYTTRDKEHGPTITFKWDIPWGTGDDWLEVTTTGDIKLECGSFRGSSVLRRIVEIAIKDDAPIL